MVAHGFYESLGYRDVYTPELAVKACGQVQKPTRYELAKVKESEEDILEKLHHEATSGRLGFTPRPQGLIRSVLTLGARSMAREYTLFTCGQLETRVSQLLACLSS
jgi:hypothetical protein